MLFPRSINSSSNPTPRSLQLSDCIQAREVRRMGELIKTFNKSERELIWMTVANAGRQWCAGGLAQIAAGIDAFTRHTIAAPTRPACAS